MSLYLGVDLGTSGLKAVFVREDGKIVSMGYQAYGIDTPQLHYAQQEPQVWWDAMCGAIGQALEHGLIDPKAVRGVGFSGQMHSTVMLDAQLQVLYPAIIWCDQRSIAQAEVVRTKVGEQLGPWVQNAVSPGFQICTLLWMREHHPEIYQNIRHVLLPKDYLRLRLTGMLGTDITDAASTLLFDCANKCWSKPMLEAMDISLELFPQVGEPCDLAGKVTAAAATATGLLEGTNVVFGGGDQPMQAVGNGILKCGDASLTLGTGGQILLPTDVPCYDTSLRTHTFCHANGKWYVMGATLGACLSLNWLMENILHCDDVHAMDHEAMEAPPGSNGLIFLPYLTGERTPHMDPNACGMFFGLQLGHNRGMMVRAVMEGVAFSLRDAMEVIQQLGLDAPSLVITGGGAQSELWKQIIADVLQKPVYTSGIQKAAGVGAAICAMVGTGAYGSLEKACAAIVHHGTQPVLPIKANAMQYNRQHEIYRALYQNNKSLFTQAPNLK